MNLEGQLPVATRDWGNWFAGEIDGVQTDADFTQFNMDGPHTLIMTAATFELKDQIERFIYASPS